MNAKRFLIVTVAALLLTAVLLTPGATLAQGPAVDPCSTQAAAIVMQIAASGASVRVQLDPTNACSFVVSPLAFVGPLAAPRAVAAASAPVTTTSAVTVTRPIVISSLGSPYVIHRGPKIVAVDYARDLGEVAPEVLGQDIFVNELVMDAIKLHVPINDVIYE